MGKSRIGNLISQLKSQIDLPLVKKTVGEFLERPTQKVFQMRKNEMLAEFRNLPVIEALEYGPGFGSNDFAGILGGKGDLFSFLGFRRKVKPTNALYAVIKKMKITRSLNVFGGKFLKWQVVDFPSVEAFEKATADQLEWADGYSWVTGLERGVPGLGRYVNAPFDSMGIGQSRSHYGLQKQEGSNSASQPINWIRPFLDEWFQKFEEIGFQIIR